LQIGADVAQNIDELQSFAKSNSIHDERCAVNSRWNMQMRQAHLRPELTHATRNAIGVVIQFVIALQSNDPIAQRLGEAFEIELLSAGDGVENFPDQRAVCVGLRVEQRQRLLHTLQQDAFAGGALLLGELAEVESHSFAIDAGAQFLESI
jgi:hypothetical protein